MSTPLTTPITSLHGVGPARAAAYARIGVSSVGELLMHYPRGYENRGDVRLLSETEPDGKSAVLLTVATEARAVRLKARMTLVKFRAFDESGSCEITFFNQEYLKNAFPIGAEFRFYGHVGRTKNGYTMASPAFEPYSDGAELPPLMPVYPLTEGLTQKQIAKDMRSAMTIASVAEDASEFLPEDIRARYSLCTRGFALRQIHNPDSFSSLAKAKKRLIFDELFIFSLGVRRASTKFKRQAAPPCKNTDISELTASLPYALTSAQARSIDIIAHDMSSGTAMNRILIGDVGCGKTVCAEAAAYIAFKNGLQTAVMVPTEILALQHFDSFCALLEPLGVRCGLLVGSLTPAKKKRVREAAANGELDIIIGTQALLSNGVGLFRPGLVIADEQHRFGVGQRATLAEKSKNSHMLVMSATPIPRTLALAVYGNLDVSKIDEMPKGRQRVDTFVVNESYRERLNAFISKQIQAGGRVYIVCPAVEEQKKDEEIDLTLGDIDGEGEIYSAPPLKSAVAFAEEMTSAFPQYSVAFLHGKMKPADKEKITRMFGEGEIQILVSTTVIEVGVNVPEANLMIVENAERFGLSQLHQLRGRVGRGSLKSYCILVSDAPEGGRAHERLQTMKGCYDGFAIAEKDLLMRGPGDFLRGTASDTVRQSGGVKFRLAELCDDAEILQNALVEADTLLHSSPELQDYPALREQVNRMFTLEDGTVN